MALTHFRPSPTATAILKAATLRVVHSSVTAPSKPTATNVFSVYTSAPSGVHTEVLVGLVIVGLISGAVMRRACRGLQHPNVVTLPRGVTTVKRIAGR